LSDVLTGYCAIRGSFDPPRCLNPFPLCPAFPNSLDGRDSVEYYGFAAPPVALATYPPTPLWGAAEGSGVARI